MTLPAPYWSRGSVSLFHGDARELLPLMPQVETILTDPVWPISVHSRPSPDLAGHEDPLGLFAHVASMAPGIARRLIVWLSAASDVRFLSVIPPALAFQTTVRLEYARPVPCGRVLKCDAAYVFGSLPRLPYGVLPGRTIAGDATDNAQTVGFPTPRKFEHARWLVDWYGGDSVLDPMAGSGTTLLAAQELGLRAIGIEVSEDACDVAVERLERAHGQARLPFPAPLRAVPQATFDFADTA